MVILPAFADSVAMPVASGKSYEEAMARGKNSLENIVEFFREQGRPLPQPQTFAGV